MPWNYPLLLLAWKLAPALAAGNTVVCKPSELTPLSTLMLAPCFEHLPPGVVNLLAGAGDVGEAIVRDERVDCVAFTGSVETGKRVARLAAERVARVNLEMGGKDPFIVCADVADQIEVAAKGGAWAAYLNAGQVCTSAERFYVWRSVYDDYLRGVRRLHRLAACSAIRSTRRPTSGRWCRSDQRAAVADQVEAAVAAGATLVTGGDDGGQERGHFFAPAVVTGAPRRDRPAARGDVRPGRADRSGQVTGRGDRARELDPLRPRLQRLHARPRDDPALHARDQGGHRLVQRPADGQRRRARSAE